MSILNDAEISRLAQLGMITPFAPAQIRTLSDGAPAISRGLSSFGYDITLSVREFRIFRRLPGDVVDPKAFTVDHLEYSTLHTNNEGAWFILPAHSYALGVTVERFVIPSDVVGICVGKSTYARCGVITNITPLEPGWSGHLTLEISNSSDSDVRVYAGEGIAQLLFLRGERPDITYEDRAGKYQDQAHAVTIARI